jgi:hypothetical protein
VWNSLGSLPQANEVEVSLIGPGYGESLVVHLGQGEWLIVDSCIDTTDSHRRVVPLRYLQELGVRVESAVKFIVVSHWDDDHARGLGDIVEACPVAKLVCSKVFPTDKFANFVEALSIGSAATEGGAVRNFRKLLNCLNNRGQVIVRATPGRTLCSSPVIQSWSPSDHDDTHFLYYVAETHPRAGEPLRKAIPATGNLTSVVLTVDWPDTSALFGADMESSSDGRRGWGAIVTEATSLRRARKGELVKIPHHGSHTAHDDRMWEALLHPQPISILAPFGKGPIQSRPPTSNDIRRIKQLSRTTLVTARHTAAKPPKMSAAVTRSLREGAITLSSRKTPIGMVRLRRQTGGQWQQELFGTAFRVT